LKKLLIIVFGLALLPLTGCATIIHGRHQTVGISSSPPGAKVTVDNQSMGVTPVNLELKRNQEHTVIVSLDGYESWSGTLQPSASGWLWGNIAFGGLIGLAVDFGTGGAYNLHPEDLSATLTSKPTMASK
jgi:hypothetical protein